MGEKTKLSLSDLYEIEDFEILTNEIYDRLGYCFTTEQNFIEIFSNTPMASTVTHYRLTFGGALDLVTQSSPIVYSYCYQSSVSDYECSLAYSFL